MLKAHGAGNEKLSRCLTEHKDDNLASKLDPVEVAPFTCNIVRSSSHP